MACDISPVFNINAKIWGLYYWLPFDGFIFAFFYNSENRMKISPLKVLNSGGGSKYGTLTETNKSIRIKMIIAIIVLNH